MIKLLELLKEAKEAKEQKEEQATRYAIIDISRTRQTNPEPESNLMV